ncbi:hypothetical protein T439DRAFT_359317 [Meredithblackwellia eburnea MCA 4105]
MSVLGQRGGGWILVRLFGSNGEIVPLEQPRSTQSPSASAYDVLKRGFKALRVVRRDRGSGEHSSGPENPGTSDVEGLDHEEDSEGAGERGRRDSTASGIRTRSSSTVPAEHDHRHPESENLNATHRHGSLNEAADPKNAFILHVLPRDRLPSPPNNLLQSLTHVLSQNFGLTSWLLGSKGSEWFPELVTCIVNQELRLREPLLPHKIIVGPYRRLSTLQVSGVLPLGGEVTWQLSGSLDLLVLNAVAQCTGSEAQYRFMKAILDFNSSGNSLKGSESPSKLRVNALKLVLHDEPAFIIGPFYYAELYEEKEERWTHADQEIHLEPTGHQKHSQSRRRTLRELLTVLRQGVFSAGVVKLGITLGLLELGDIGAKQDLRFDLPAVNALRIELTPKCMKGWNLLSPFMHSVHRTLKHLDIGVSMGNHYAHMYKPALVDATKLGQGEPVFPALTGLTVFETQNGCADFCSTTLKPTVRQIFTQVSHLSNMVLPLSCALWLRAPHGEIPVAQLARNTTFFSDYTPGKYDGRHGEFFFVCLMTREIAEAFEKQDQVQFRTERSIKIIVPKVVFDKLDPRDRFHPDISFEVGRISQGNDEQSFGQEFAMSTAQPWNPFTKKIRLWDARNEA